VCDKVRLCDSNERVNGSAGARAKCDVAMSNVRMIRVAAQRVTTTKVEVKRMVGRSSRKVRIGQVNLCRKIKIKEAIEQRMQYYM
jgi:hypothetical protein